MRTKCLHALDLRIQLTAIYPELSTTLNKDSKVTAHKVFDAAIEHLQQQFEYFYQNGQTEIQKLLDAFRMPFIIDNTCLLLTACASGTIFREVSWSDTLSEDCVTGDGSKRLLAKCHKMGLFPTMGVLATPGHVLSELVADVLYESPIGPLLERIPNAEVRLKQSLSDVQHIDHMSNCLYREHLDDLANLILSLHADNECKAKLLHYVQVSNRRCFCFSKSLIFSAVGIGSATVERRHKLACKHFECRRTTAEFPKNFFF